jgi:ferredoxin-NADP reductase
MKPDSFTLVLDSSYMITDKVKHFVFHLSNQKTLDYLPGQFITLYFEHQGQKLHRSYSLANSPNSTGRLEFAAGLVPQGVGSSFLSQLQPGDTIEARGPFGRLILKDFPPKRYIFVGTSTGITPYRAMLSRLSNEMKNTTLSVVILQGVSTRMDCLYHDEFVDFAEQHGAQYYACLSKELQSESQYEHLGHVQDTLVKLELDPTQDIIYLCGNPSMIDDTYQLLQEHAFPSAHIVREKYISR